MCVISSQDRIRTCIWIYFLLDPPTKGAVIAILTTWLLLLKNASFADLKPAFSADSCNLACCWIIIPKDTPEYMILQQLIEMILPEAQLVI